MMNGYTEKTVATLSFLLLITMLVSCGGFQRTPQPLRGDRSKPNIVATTSILGDVVAQVGGELIELHVLLPVGVDPHTFEPAPRDIVMLAEADIIFAVGLGLEALLDPLLESTSAEERVVFVSQGIELLRLSDPGKLTDNNHKHLDSDPHVWMDPNNVIIWTQNIELALSALDPSNAETYKDNSQAYQDRLIELDAWIRAEISQIPEEKRKIVTDHLIFGYFTTQYGLTQVGAIIPGYSTLAEPSAQDLAKLEDAILELQVSALFIGNTVNPSLAEQVAKDTGTQLVFIYTGSLSPEGGEADTYIKYLQYNVNAMVTALK
ncbi:MAG: zinc ABC transporter substrate-binding protein [Chloroflexota bacterium]